MAESINRRTLFTAGGLGAGALLASGLTQPARATASGKRDWGSPVWAEEFNGSSLDRSKWTVSHNTFRPDWGWLQAGNVEVSDGRLRLHARRMDHGVKTPDGRWREWSTAELSTAGKFSMEYGRWEVSAKVPNAPTGQVGMWPGVWLRPDNGRIGGEIDIVEAYGSKSSQARTKFNPSNRTESTVHFNQQRHGSLHGWSPANGNTSGRFNHWAMEKLPSGITMWFNGQELIHVPSSHTGFSAAFPRGMKFNLRATFQVGNTYWGQPTSATQSHSVFEVDYIRAYKY